MSDSCVGYELPDKGECRQVFERSCSHEVCTPSVGIQAIPGSGTLKGRITMDLEPVVGATVVIGSLSAFTDERGGFVIEAGPGTHVVEIYGAGLEVQRATATLGSGEDAVVAISIRCDQVDSGSCCKF